MTRILMLPAAGVLFALTACNPYDPGAAIGAAFGGGTGAAVGAATGAVFGAVTGASTTLPPEQVAPPPYTR